MGEEVGNNFAMSMLCFRIVLLGDRNTGKTSWLSQIRTGKFADEHVPTESPTVHSFFIPTSHPTTINLGIWDMPGNDPVKEYLETNAEYDCIGPHACIAFYTQNSDHEETDELLRRHPDTEKVIVWNKCDDPAETRHFSEMSDTPQGRYLLRRGCGRETPAFLLSGRMDYNVKAPLLHVVRRLAGDKNLEFLPSDRNDAAEE